MLKTYQYKIYRRRKNTNLHRLVNLHGVLYNHCIALHRKYFALTGKHLNQYALANHLVRLKKREGFEWLKTIGSQSAQDVVWRIEKGYALFFSERKKGNKRIMRPGFRKDLNLAGMKALWGRKVSDLAFHAFTQKLKYLLEASGKEFGKRDRFLASSKTLFDCGWKNDALSLAERTWTCQCSAVVERDLNAAGQCRGA